MRVKGWMAIALAVTVAGGGTSVLAQTMSGDQMKEVTKVVQIKNVPASSSADTLQSTNTAANPSDYVIEKELKDGFSIKKTKADLSMKEAVSRVVRTIQNIFGDRTAVKKVTGVDLTKIGLYDDRYADSDSKYRAYVGFVLCEGNMGFEFSINSITGQVTEITKCVNQIDSEYENPDACEKLDNQIAENTAKYKKTAKEFLGRNLTDRKVKRCRVMSGSYSGQGGGIRLKKIVATAECEMEDGMLYWIRIDPKTNEVFGWTVMGWGE